MTVYKFSNVSGFKNYQKYNDFLAGNPAVILDKGSMYPLGVFTLSANQAEIEFTNIPQTYTHLQLRILARTTLTDNALSPMVFQFNGNTTSSNYRTHQLIGNGSSAASYDVSTWAGAGAGGVINGGNSNYFSAIIVDILDYKNTNKNTTVRILYGADANGSGDVGLWSGAFFNTAAITSIKTAFPQGRTIATNSSFALYGVLA